MENEQKKSALNRGTGMLIIEVRHSNPNGDPDMESEPRTIDTDEHGLISPVSFKRKLRDLVGDHEGPAWESLKAALNLDEKGKRQYDILEKRGRNRDAIFDMEASDFTNTYWDARVFGNTFLESIKGKEIEPGKKEHFITTGVVQFAPGVSIAPVDIERLTMTNKSGVQEGKDRGMAPLAWRVVRHAVYTMPFFVNPMMASKSGCDAMDIDVMKFLIPLAYRNTASAIRPFVEIRHAWYAEHKTPLGSCPDSFILDALTPRTKGEPNDPTKSIEEYDIPNELPADVMDRLESFEDLCLKEW